LRFLSLFSGIEAASTAWEPLGWEPVAFSEIEPFPCAVLAHHWPHIPNLGDVTQIEMKHIKKLGAIDIVIFGSPCQDLSVAGKRAGLDGERSGLFRSAIRIVRWARKHNKLRFALWENVPGAFSTNSGRDFAAVVREMSGADVGVPSDGWKNTGVAFGREGFTEWSVLDAQWFGVPQRRRRVFALSDFGSWRDRPPILFERESLCGNPAPSREKGEGTAADVAPSITSSGPPFSRTGNSRVETEALVTTFSTPALGDVREDEIASTMQAKTGSAGETQNPAYVATYRKPRRVQSTTDHESWVEDDIANTINTFDVGDVGDVRSTNAVAYRPQNFGDEGGGYTEADVSNSLDATQGSKQTHLAVAFNWQEDRTFKVGEQANPLRASQTEAIAVRTAQTSVNGIGVSDVAHTLDGVQGQAVAFTADVKQVQWASGGGEIENDTAQAIRANPETNYQFLRQQMQVRRLTPVECCRLQGFSDDHLDITYRNKPAPDGAKYKALGNSMAVPVIRWIGKQISCV